MCEAGPHTEGNLCRWDGGVRAHRHGPGAQNTHTGLKLGVNVVQHVKGLVPDVPQGRVSYAPQHLQCQGQLSLQGHRALPHLRRGDRQVKAACKGKTSEEG